MVKPVWQYGRTGGKYIGEWAEDVVVQVPYTDVPPLKEIKLEDQFYIPSEHRWKEIMNQLDREALDNLNALYTAVGIENAQLQAANVQLTEKQATQENQLTEAQLALAEMYEMILPPTKGAK